MISVFFGQPHLGYLIFEQGSGLRGSQKGHLRVVQVFARILWEFFKSREAERYGGRVIK